MNPYTSKLKIDDLTTSPEPMIHRFFSKLLSKINNSNRASHRFAPVSRRIPKIIDEKLPKFSVSPPNFYTRPNHEIPSCRLCALMLHRSSGQNPYFKPVTRQNVNLRIYSSVIKFRNHQTSLHVHCVLPRLSRTEFLINSEDHSLYTI